TDLTSTHDIREKRFLISLQRSLEKKFSTLEGVKSASVSITPANVGSYGFSKGDDAKASVFLTLKPNKTVGKQTVLGIASITAQSVSGLKAKNVSIMDTNGRLYKVPDIESEAGIAQDKTEAEAEAEERIAEKVRNLLAGIITKEEVYVEVSLDLNFDRVQEDKEELGPTIDIESQESSSVPMAMGAAGGGTPDLLKGATTIGGGGGIAKTEKKINTISTPSFKKRTNKVVTPGERKDATISVLLPKKENVKLPTESELKDWIHGATNIDTSKISVAFFEIPKQEEKKPEEAITFAAQVGDYAGKYGGQVALGFFALFSLFMIYKVVKQAMPTKDLYTEIAMAREAVGESPLSMGGGGASPGGGAEKATRMRTGVRDLVLRNPRSVANVLKRWVMSR
ncbi:hypothetical protein HY605_01665, partial [Candidatus Peregrinibacteria bacterium]|nr:hypothetical protein [Candidatus Peregrinibacteria bacterium]